MLSHITHRVKRFFFDIESKKVRHWNIVFTALFTIVVSTFFYFLQTNQSRLLFSRIKTDVLSSKLGDLVEEKNQEVTRTLEDIKRVQERSTWPPSAYTNVAVGEKKEIVPVFDVDVPLAGFLKRHDFSVTTTPPYSLYSVIETGGDIIDSSLPQQTFLYASIIAPQYSYFMYNLELTVARVLSVYERNGGIEITAIEEVCTSQLCNITEQRTATFRFLFNPETLHLEEFRLDS